MDTRLGTLYLYIPKLRKTGYIPFFITKRKRSELALMTLVQEAFINGVSTRQIERLAKAIGIENISAAQVLEITKGLEDQVTAFRTRPLEEEYPFLWVDALYDKVRIDDQVVSLALMIAHAVNKAGERQILAIEPMFDETEDSWRAFFRKLKSRGLKRLSLCISDAHAGIQAAVRKEWLGASWQRCKVHFMRNILAKVSHKEKARFAERLKQIWLQPDKRSAKRMAALLAEEYEKRCSSSSSSQGMSSAIRSQRFRSSSFPPKGKSSGKEGWFCGLCSYTWEMAPSDSARFSRGFCEKPCI